MQQFQSIHYLRAVAALMVVVLHIHTTIEFMRHGAADVGWLRGGVDIFFIISGFVMVRSTAGKAISPREFFIRRCQRIVPLYWWATLISMSAIEGQFLYKIASMFFIPVTSPVSGALEPVVPPGWTLNYEMFFYLLFAFSLWLTEKWRFWALAALLSALVTMSIFVPASGLAAFYTNPIMLEFLVGMAIAKYNLKGSVLLIPFGFVLMFLMYTTNDSRLLTLGVPSAFIVMGAIGSEQRVNSYRILNILGDASYSIYIFHLIALGVLLKNWGSLGLDRAYFAPVAVIFIVVVAVALHWVLERPIIDYFARRNAQSSDLSSNTADSIFKRQANKAAFKTE